MKYLSFFVLSVFLIVGISFAVNGRAEAQTLPVGCTTTAGYSPTTGVSCNGSITVPAGCTSTAGFSASTGEPCNGETAAANGFNGAMIGTNGFMNGCTSTFGFSTTTGISCAMMGGGTVTPGLPTTGAGGNALMNVALLVVSAGAATLGILFLTRRKTAHAK